MKEPVRVIAEFKNRTAALLPNDSHTPETTKPRVMRGFISFLSDDVTGVLVQCTSRIPLSYRRKTKNPQHGLFDYIRLSLLIAAIVAQLCQACLNKTLFWTVFNMRNEKTFSFIFYQKFPGRQKYLCPEYFQTPADTFSGFIRTKPRRNNLQFPGNV